MSLEKKWKNASKTKCGNNYLDFLKIKTRKKAWRNSNKTFLT